MGCAMHRQLSMESYEHAAGVGKKIIVVALDYDRCGKMMSDGWERKGSIAAMNTSALAQLLYGLGHNRFSSHMHFVSFSDRQSDKINTEYFGDEPRVNLEHLDKAGALLHTYARLQNIEFDWSADKQYFLDQGQMDALSTKAAFKAYVQLDRKQELAAKIRAAYPDAAKFVFIDNESSNLPQPVVDKIYTVHFAPLVQDPKTVTFNHRAF